MTPHTQWLYTVDDEGGVCELFNGERTLANLRGTDSCGIFTVVSQDCKWSNGILPFALDPCAEDEDGESTWPSLDFTGGVEDSGNPAPWWDGVPNSPSSGGYGFWIEEWTGLDGAHQKRNVSQRTGRRGGANFGSLSAGSRTWKMNVVMVGEDGVALEWMFRWLEQQLLDSCNPCGGSDMLIRTSCPPENEPAFDLYRVKGASLIEGLTWEDPPIQPLACKIRRVSFTLGVADPCLYSCAEACVTQESFDFIADCIPIDMWIGCNVSCTDLAPYRICCPVPATTRGIISPVVTIENETTETSVPLRIYGMSDPLGLGCDPCALAVCQSIRTRAIPAGSALMIDSATRRVLFRGPETNQEWVDGTAYLDPDPGTAPSYLSLTCDPGWVAVEPSTFCGGLDNLLVSIDILSRVGCS